EELGKVAGVYKDQQKMMLFLELSTEVLAASEKQQITSTLSADLQLAMSDYKPIRLAPKEAKELAPIGSSAIITGVPKFIEGKSDFKGFIIVPIMAGSAMTMVMIPMIEQYNVYHLTDDISNKDFIIAHAKNQAKLPEVKISCGGIIKELSANKSGNGEKDKFLEALYYTIV
ncbi:MAG: hypothetical protein ABJI36_16745, partial [Kangiellaceae bacterium]